MLSSIYRVTTQPITITTENIYNSVIIMFIVRHFPCSYHSSQTFPQTTLKMPFTFRSILLTCFSSSSCKNTRRGSTNIFAYRKYELIHMKVCIILLKNLDEKTHLQATYHKQSQRMCLILFITFNKFLHKISWVVEEETPPERLTFSTVFLFINIQLRMVGNENKNQHKII